MTPTEERKLTFDERVELLYQEMMASRLPKPKPKPAPKPVPKPAAQRAQDRWSDKPLSAVLQDAQRAEAAATERLRRERESDRIAAEHKRALYQAEIDAAWQRNLDYQAELRGLGRPSFHKGPGNADW